SEEVQEAVYGCSWFLRRKGFKKLVPMMLMRSSRCSKMSASVFFDLSFETFSLVNVHYAYLLINIWNDLLTSICMGYLTGVRSEDG
ncbi:hypothetical protein L9F63_004468, partial [Diploptera punctata]